MTHFYTSEDRVKSSLRRKYNFLSSRWIIFHLLYFSSFVFVISATKYIGHTHNYIYKAYSSTMYGEKYDANIKSTLVCGKTYMGRITYTLEI